MYKKLLYLYKGKLFEKPVKKFHNRLVELSGEFFRDSDCRLMIYKNDLRIPVKEYLRYFSKKDLTIISG